ncbi:CgeB family protein [Bacillus thuringiensis]
MNILLVRSGIPFYYPKMEESIYKVFKKIVNKVEIADYTDIIKTALKMKPDIIIVLQGLSEIITNQIVYLQQIGFMTAIWLTDDPYYIDYTKKVVPFYNFVFTQDYGAIEIYKKLGCANAFYLPLAVDQSIFQPNKKSSSYKYEICFMGTAFDNRLDFIDKVSNYLAKKNTIIVGNNWDKLKNYSILKDKIKLLPIAVYEDTANYYTEAKINLNLHRSNTDTTFNSNSENIIAQSINNRTFEIAAHGAFQLTDFRPNLTDLYTPGADLDTFHSPEEFIQKTEFYLNNEYKRNKIAIKGLQHTLQHHTYEKRIPQLLNIIQQSLH